LQARPLKLAPMGAGRPSTTFLVASSIVVDSVPAPAMTAVGSVALLPDFTVNCVIWEICGELAYYSAPDTDTA
jgi:hypothetical protein